MNLKKFTIFVVALISGMGMSFGQTIFLDEDFNGGLPDAWNSVEVKGNGTESATWIYTTEGAMGSVPLGAIASSTAENGWMIFDSDLNCSGEQDAWLISPEMTISDLSSIWLRFESYYLSYNDRPQIRIGNNMDDLASWQTVEVFPGIAYNEFEVGVSDPNLAQNPVVVEMDLSTAFQAVGGTSFYIAFEFLSDATTNNGGSGAPGCAYAWNIDDVLLTDEDLRNNIDMVMTDFIALAGNTTIPTSQIAPIDFLANFGNVGSMDIDASTVSIKIDNLTTGENVFNTSQSFPAIASGTILENEKIGDSFTPPATVADYFVTYSIAPDGLTDDNVFDNRRTYTFSVTDTAFQKSSGPYIGISVDGSDSYTMGNVYHVVNGSGLWARYSTFGVSNASDIAGDSIEILLYEWDGDTNDDGRMNLSEVTGGAPVAYNKYVFTGAEDDQELSIPVDTSMLGFELTDDKYYVSVLKYTSFDGKECLMMGDDHTDYAASSVLQNDVLGTPEYFSAYTSGTGAELEVGSTNLIPFMRLSIGANPILATVQPILAEDAVRLFPNPVLDATNLSFDLKQISDVEVEIYDVNGKLMQWSHYPHILKEMVTIDAQSLSSGNYQVRIKTNSGTRTLKMSVLR